MVSPCSRIDSTTTPKVMVTISSLYGKSTTSASVRCDEGHGGGVLSARDGAEGLPKIELGSLQQRLARQ